MATIYEIYEGCGSDVVGVQGDQQAGETFTAISDHNLNILKLWLIRVGSPGCTLTVKLYNVDGDHKPTGSVLASGTIATSEIGTSEEWVEIDVTEYSVDNGTEYAIVLSLDGGDGSNYISFPTNWEGDLYADGIALFSLNSGGSWFTYTWKDASFQVLYEAPPAPVTPEADINPDAFTGYHCFREQFQKRRKAGLIPYKQPDGTLYRDAPSG